MEYVLRPKKRHYISILLLPLAVCISLAVIISSFLQYSDVAANTALPGYQIYSEPSFGDVLSEIFYESPAVLIQLILLILFIPLSIVVIRKNLFRQVTFNNTHFTFRDCTYTYQQIEKVKIRGGKYGRIFYYVTVNGKCLFVYEAYYEGAKEFQFYLDYYKVPIAPYWQR